MTNSLKGQRYRCKTFLPKHFHDKLSGEIKYLGCGWYAKQIRNETKLFFQLGGCVYREMTRACFDTTMRNSRHLPVDEIKTNLKNFEEANNAIKSH